MIDTLFFVHADENAAAGLAAHYSALGWNVATSGPNAADALEKVALTNPVAAVFCLTGTYIAEVHALAVRILGDGRVHRPLMVFVGGSDEEIGLARDDTPYAVFVNQEELPWVLKRLVAKY